MGHAGARDDGRPVEVDGRTRQAGRSAVPEQDGHEGDAHCIEQPRLEADLKLILRATAQELSDPRIDGPLRAPTVDIELDPELAAPYAERLDGPMKELQRERLRGAQRVGELAEDLDLDLAIEVLWGPMQNRWLMHSGPLTPATRTRWSSSPSPA